MKGILVVAILLAISLTAWGQSTGTITGNVLDASGSAIPNVKVTATNIETNVANSVESTGAGVYSIPGLAPGKYRVEAAVAGFKTFRLQEPVVVFTATTSSLDIHMEVGEVTQTVEVSGSATTLQLDTPEVSAEIDSKSLFDLPLQLSNSGSGGTTGRRTLDSFITLTPGVTGDQFSKSINGGQTLSSETIIDGISWQINIVPGIIGTFGPPYEALEEFKVQTTLFPAEYARGMGVTNFTMKSGTNSFHGNAFDILRNDVLEANSFFANSQGLARPIVRQNEWGAGVGGPVIIPKVYNGKDKTFFYFTYTGFKRRGGSALQSNVTLPTPAMKQGDFSDWLDPAKTGAGIPIVIYDPQTTRSDGQGGFVRDPFPGNIIPANRISAVAGRVIPLIPDPDSAGLTNNWVSRSKEPVDDWDWSVKIDHTFSARHKLNYSMWIQKDDRFIYGDVPGTLDHGQINDEVGRGVRLNYDFFIRPNLINHLGLGYGRRRSDFFPPASVDKTNDYFQIPAIGTFATANATPNFNIGDITSLGTQWATTLERGNTYNLVDNVTWIRGRHSVKTGLDFRKYQYNTWYPQFGQGIFNFDNRLTSQPNSPDFGILGQAFASFLLGQVQSFNQDREMSRRGFHNDYYSAFVQDDFKITPRLSMSYGVRFEVPLPLSEQYDRLSALDLSLPNPGAGGRPGALAFAGFGPGHTGKKRFADTHYDWSPRIGLAYQVNEKTVVRAGYGIFHSQTNGNAADGYIVGAVGTGYQYQPFSQSPDNGVHPAFLLDNGPVILPVQLPTLDPTLANNSSADYIDSQSGKTAYVNSWNLSLQRELPGKILLDAAYVGQHGVNLVGSLSNLNQVPSRYLSLGPLLTADITDPAAAAAGIFAPYAGFTGSVAQALRPYPQFSNIGIYAEPTASNRYHSFQLKVQKRFSEGLSFLVSYTASKNITNAESNSGFSYTSPRPPDTEQRHLEWAVATNDIPQNLVTSFVYELPVGPGKRFVNKGGAVGKILGGWQIAGIARYYSGTPLRIRGGAPLPLFGGSQRPNRVPGVDIRTAVSRSNFDPAKDLWLNVDAFEKPAAYTIGNVGPRLPNVRGFPGYNEDFTIFKFIPFTEQMKLEFRAEMYNVFNRVNFGGIGQNINNTSSFGTVSGVADPRHIQFMLKFHF
ncbi:MAG: hypothetical protein DMG06_07430 [Acidobacteria bacterium]|nr:MAG: hypothetical protein DMG06_07430 [Acidobacteriota bacterium]